MTRDKSRVKNLKSAGLNQFNQRHWFYESYWFYWFNSFNCSVWRRKIFCLTPRDPGFFGTLLKPAPLNPKDIQPGRSDPPTAKRSRCAIHRPSQSTDRRSSRPARQCPRPIKSWICFDQRGGSLPAEILHPLSRGLRPHESRARP